MIRIRRLHNVYPRVPRLFRLLAIIAILLFLFGLVIHLTEPKTFPSLYDGIWWAIVTVSTVGYGDYSPVTPFGRVIGMLLILSGVGIVTSYFAYLAKMSISTEQQFITGTKEFTGSGHFIIVGWNGRSKRIIQRIHELTHQQSLVLIDDTLQQHPLPRTNIHFIHGKATLDSVLLKANIKEAARVLITADLRQNELQTDMFSVLTLLAIKGLNPQLYCLVEILTEEQKENALRAGADGIIETNKFAGEYMEKCLQEGMKVDLNEERDLGLQPMVPHVDWVGLTFKQASGLLLEKDILLVGIIAGGETKIKPAKETIIHPNDTLLIIKD